ncbi:MAG: LamG domain-containing protein, partial [Candidatus Micrarchaeia archaeon]
MEYLMTYGWAILIIAVVLGALYQLGVFSQYAFAPKAPPGSCQVYRPNGPGTTQFVSLQGVCSGELPQFVPAISTHGYVVVPAAPMNNTPAYTLVMWIDMLNTTPPYGPIIYSNGDPYTQLQLGISSANTLYMQIWNSSSNSWNGYYSPYVVPTGKWSFVAASYTNTNGMSGVIRLYVDNYNQSGPFRELYNSYSYESGIGINVGYYNANQGYQGFNGYISNVQVYNTSLSASEIDAIYQEGIGGAPIKLQNLVGWWPLNGNANDYSGNQKNGIAVGGTFDGSWYSGYAPP